MPMSGNEGRSGGPFITDSSGATEATMAGVGVILFGPYDTISGCAGGCSGYSAWGCGDVLVCVDGG